MRELRLKLCLHINSRGMSCLRLVLQSVLRDYAWLNGEETLTLWQRRRFHTNWLFERSIKCQLLYWLLTNYDLFGAVRSLFCHNLTSRRNVCTSSNAFGALSDSCNIEAARCFYAQMVKDSSLFDDETKYGGVKANFYRRVIDGLLISDLTFTYTLWNIRRVMSIIWYKSRWIYKADYSNQQSNCKLDHS